MFSSAPPLPETGKSPAISKGPRHEAGSPRNRRHCPSPRAPRYRRPRTPFLRTAGMVFFHQRGRGVAPSRRTRDPTRYPERPIARGEDRESSANPAIGLISREAEQRRGRRRSVNQKKTPAAGRGWRLGQYTESHMNDTAITAAGQATTAVLAEHPGPRIRSATEALSTFFRWRRVRLADAGSPASDDEVNALVRFHRAFIRDVGNVSPQQTIDFLRRIHGIEEPTE